MLTIHEQERFAFCTNSPAYSAIADACDTEDMIEALELQVEALEHEVEDLVHWRDGDKENELDEARANVERLEQINEQLRRELREIIADLLGTQCKTAQGRKELARITQNRLANLR